MSELWRRQAAAAGRELDPGQIERLGRYLDLLLAANERTNLTRIAGRAEAEVQHVGDALSLLPWLPEGPFDAADVGSGGGVPGLVLAIARPDLRFVLIESTRKKSIFLAESVGQLGLTNVEVLAERVEDVAHTTRRERFRVVTARAVAALEWLVEWSLPLLAPGGRLLAPKGPRVRDEVTAGAAVSRLLGGGDPEVHPIELPGTTGHVVVVVQKVRATDLRYPRPASVAKGRSLLRR